MSRDPVPTPTAPQPIHLTSVGGGARFFLSTFHFHSNGHFQTPFEAANDLGEAWEILLDPPWRSNAAGRQAMTFLEAVEAQFKEERSPKFYANYLHLSLPSLRKACQQSLRCPPTRCIHLRLMLEAIRLLEATDLQVQAIGWELGFQDPVYFNLFFRKHTGWAPAKLRAFLDKEQ